MIEQSFQKDLSLCDQRPEVVGRFAPSPSGRFHIGNIFASMIAALVADRMILRIEDLDPDRSKPQFIEGVMRDLEWFGFEWVGEVLYQSAEERQAAYQEACAKLEAQGLVYPCFCSRADLHSARAPHVGEEFIYQNTCKFLTEDEIAEREKHRDPALRLDVSPALEPVCFLDRFQSEQCFDLIHGAGDFIIKRSDGVFAYQLAVVVDDAFSGITSVVRGCDLLASTPKQLYLQELLGFDHPSYGHVPIFVDEQGRKLSKRNEDASLSYLIEDLKMSAQDILGYLAWLSGIIPEQQSMSLHGLRRFADLDALMGKQQIVWCAPGAAENDQRSRR